MPGWCSVENLVSSENHDVVSDRSQMEFTVLGPIGACSERGALQTFEHAVHGFNLPTLSIVGAMQMTLHPASPAATGSLVGGATDGGRNERAHAQFIPGMMMSVFGVVPSIGSNRVDAYPAQGFTQQLTEV